MERCVIVLSGPMGAYERVRGLFRRDDFVLCADGGLIHARALGLPVRMLVGDMDSLGFPPPAGLPLLRFPPEKDDTDTFLAVDWALKKGFRKFLLVGGLRGRLDHTVTNFSVLLHLCRAGAAGMIADGDNEAHMLLSGVMRFPRRPGWYISAFPFEHEARGVCERGLKYPLENATLHNDREGLGVSNEFTDAPVAEISAERGPLLIILSKK